MRPFAIRLETTRTLDTPGMREVLLPERFETLAVVVTFSPFWAGKSHRRAKIGCAIVHRYVSYLQQKKEQMLRGGGERERQGEKRSFSPSTHGIKIVREGDAAVCDSA